MHELYELKEMLLKELKEYGSKGDLSAGTLDIVDKLTHATKNLCKVIEACEEEDYSSEGSYEGRGSYRGGSYARGRYQPRDSMGRYSRDGYSRDASLAEALRGMMSDAPDERTKYELQRLINRLGNN